MPYEQIEHTADVGIHSWGEDIEQAFSEAAKGLFSVITDINKVKIRAEEKIELTEDNWETLLVKFLSELIYLFEVKSYLFCDFEVKIDENEHIGLKVIAKGEKMDLEKHEMDTAVKGVSYHDMMVDTEGEIKVLFDV